VRRRQIIQIINFSHLKRNPETSPGESGLNI